jgi:hypothetical protein
MSRSLAASVTLRRGMATQRPVVADQRLVGRPAEQQSDSK